MTAFPQSADEEIREQVTRYILKYGNDFAEHLQGKLPDPNMYDYIEPIMQLVRAHDAALFDRAETKAVRTELSHMALVYKGTATGEIINERLAELRKEGKGGEGMSNDV
jgi:hypothetical protein